jgi:hypothetical protein
VSLSIEPDPPTSLVYSMSDNMYYVK